MMARHRHAVFLLLLLCTTAAVLLLSVVSASEEDTFSDETNLTDDDGDVLSEEPLEQLSAIHDDGDVLSEEELEQLSAIDNALDEAFYARWGEDTLGETGDADVAMEHYRKAVALNSSEAVNGMGEIWLTGWMGHEQNFTLAVELLEQAAEMGSPIAQYNLAVLHSSGLAGVQQDTSLAMVQLYFASTAGLELAQMALGYRHLKGIGVPQSCNAAVQYYQKVANAVVHSMDSFQAPIESLKLSDETHANQQQRSQHDEDADVVQYYEHAAQNGDRDAQLAMGQLNYWGARGVVQNHEVAQNYFRQAAAAGDANAMAHLGQMFIQGHGVDQNNETAVEYFDKGAASGSSAAQNGLGFAYLHGFGVKQDFKLALRYLKMAEQQNNPDAMFHLANMYADGHGVDRNYQTALQYYTNAGSLGHTQALFNVGQMHLTGLGTVQSCRMAVKMFKTVAERGVWGINLPAAHKAYHRGDFEQAAIMYARAAEMGFEVAQSNAAFLFEHGLGYEFEDRHDIAFRYLQLAADQNDHDAQRKLGDYNYYRFVEARRPASARETNRAHRRHVSAAAPKIITHVSIETNPETGQEFYSSHTEEKARTSKSTAASGGGGGNSVVFDEEMLSRLPDTPLEQTSSATNTSSVVEDVPEEEDSVPPSEAWHFVEAVRHYRLASEAHNTQALFNLGYMYQHGFGVARDFHLAKRYYDQALATASATASDNIAKVPVKLALVGLRLHKAWEPLWDRLGSLTSLESVWDELVALFDLSEDGDSEDQTTQQDSSESKSSKSAVRLDLPKLALKWYHDGENVILAALFGALGLVMFLRQQRRGFAQ